MSEKEKIFDWNCLPAWCNSWIAMEDNGKWYCYEFKPIKTKSIIASEWKCVTGERYEIPSKFKPLRYSGTWDTSLMKNPNQ